MLQSHTVHPYLLLDVPVVHIIFNNLEDYLPSGTNENQERASAIFSTQIGDAIAPLQQQSQVLESDPLSLKFTFGEVCTLNV